MNPLGLPASSRRHTQSKRTSTSTAVAAREASGVGRRRAGHEPQRLELALGTLRFASVAEEACDRAIHEVTLAVAEHAVERRVREQDPTAEVDFLHAMRQRGNESPVALLAARERGAGAPQRLLQLRQDDDEQDEHRQPNEPLPVEVERVRVCAVSEDDGGDPDRRREQ